MTASENTSIYQPVIDDASFGKILQNNKQ